MPSQRQRPFAPAAVLAAVSGLASPCVTQCASVEGVGPFLLPHSHTLRPARSLWLSWVACPGSQLCCVSHTPPSGMSEGWTQLWAEGPAAHTQRDPQAGPSRPVPCPPCTGAVPHGGSEPPPGNVCLPLASSSVGAGAHLSPRPAVVTSTVTRRADVWSFSPGAVVATPGT